MSKTNFAARIMNPPTEPKRKRGAWSGALLFARLAVASLELGKRAPAPGTVGQWMRAWRAKWGKARPNPMQAPQGGSRAAPVPRPAQRAVAASTARSVPADPDSELTGGLATVLAARIRERNRIEAIVTSPAGQARPAMARTLAFNSRVPRAAAIALMQEAPGEPDRAALSASRASRNPRLSTALPDESSTSAPAIAARWARAFARANGK